MKTSIIVCVVIIVAWLSYVAKLYINGKCFIDEEDDTPSGCLGRFLMIAAIGSGAIISYEIYDVNKLVGLLCLISILPVMAFISSRRRRK